MSLPRKPSFYDVTPSAERQLHGTPIAWVQCMHPDTEFCIIQKHNPADRWQFIVAKYRNSHDVFEDQKKFTDLIEAWKFFVDASEIYCLLEPSDVPIRKQKKKDDGES